MIHSISPIVLAHFVVLSWAFGSCHTTTRHRLDNHGIPMAIVAPNIPTSHQLPLATQVAPRSLPVAQHVTFDDRHSQALYQLIEQGNALDYQVVAQLLQKGADPNLEGYGYPPLCNAYASSDLRVASLLLRYGADINFKADEKKFNGPTPLHIAVRDSRAAAVGFLLKHGADPNLTDSNQSSPLLIAADVNNKVIIRLLLQHRVKPNLADKFGNRPLLQSVYRKDIENTRLLLQYGATPNFTNHNGWSPLLLAVAHGNEAIVELLLQKGAHVQIGEVEHKVPLAMAKYKRKKATSTKRKAKYSAIITLLKAAQKKS